MARFRIRKDTKDWFSNIINSKPIETDFDIYYFCLMLGLASGRFSNPSEKHEKVTDLVDNFVQEYIPYQRLIISLLMRTELARYGVNLTNKKAVQKFLLDLLDPDTPTKLSNNGMQRMNEYASGGYDYLSEQLNSKPYHLEEFLITYARLLRETVDNNPKWQSIPVNGI